MWELSGVCHHESFPVTYVHRWSRWNVSDLFPVVPRSSQATTIACLWPANKRKRKDSICFLDPIILPFLFPICESLDDLTRQRMTLRRPRPLPVPRTLSSHGDLDRFFQIGMTRALTTTIERWRFEGGNGSLEDETRKLLGRRCFYWPA